MLRMPSWMLCSLLVKEMLCRWFLSEHWVMHQPQHSSGAAQWLNTGPVPGHCQAAEATPPQFV